MGSIQHLRRAFGAFIGLGGASGVSLREVLGDTYRSGAGTTPSSAPAGCECRPLREQTPPSAPAGCEWRGCGTSRRYTPLRIPSEVILTGSASQTPLRITCEVILRGL